MVDNNMERELGWDDEIEKEGGNFTLLDEGKYPFTVEKFERGRFQGSDKMPACNMAKLTITIHSQKDGDVTVFHNLMLHTKTEGFLSNFFTGIGQKKKGERLRMNWNVVTGAKGLCEIEHNRYTSKGEERVNNQIKTFLPFEEYQKLTSQQAPQTQQPTQPFPTQNNTQQQTGGFTPGAF